MAKQVLVLVGTQKGAFCYRSDTSRRDWGLTGPHLPGWEFYSLLGDSRNGHRLFAGTSHFVYGPSLRVSEDFGQTWTEIEDSPRYSAESGFALKRIWQIVPGHPSQPERFYAGVEEAGLFVSKDCGRSWQEIDALTRHPTRPGWFPGNGGLCLHTILIDPSNPQRIWIGISAVGVFRTEDGGLSWQTCNTGLPEVPTGQPYPEIGRCVHKMALDPVDPNTLYMQFHGGVFKSTDGADSWTAIETGLPGNFGFPMVITASGHLYVIPLISDEQRFVKDGKLRVYESLNGGQSWEVVGTGLPEQAHFVGVLRDSMAVDSLEPAGLYFGTTMGEVYASADAGLHWQRLPGQLPRITTVKTWILED